MSVQVLGKARQVVCRFLHMQAFPCTFEAQVFCRDYWSSWNGEAHSCRCQEGGGHVSAPDIRLQQVTECVSVVGKQTNGG